MLVAGLCHTFICIFRCSVATRWSGRVTTICIDWQKTSNLLGGQTPRYYIKQTCLLTLKNICIWFGSSICFLVASSAAALLPIEESLSSSVVLGIVPDHFLNWASAGETMLEWLWFEDCGLLRCHPQAGSPKLIWKDALIACILILMRLPWNISSVGAVTEHMHPSVADRRTCLPEGLTGYAVALWFPVRLTLNS